MPAKVIDGKAIAAKLGKRIREEATQFKKRGIMPCLAVILVGDDPASLSYVSGKKKALDEAGMEGRYFHLPKTVREAELLSLIDSLNKKKSVHGILVQLPLPLRLNKYLVFESINPMKDVDCFNPFSLGEFFQGQRRFLPCTPQGIVALLKEENIPISGSHAVIVGRSNIVGKPLSMLLSRRENNATVTICHTGTRDLAEHTRRADILIAAAGKPGLIKGDMVKEGAAVIDVGVNRVKDDGSGNAGPGAKKGYRLCGDVEFDEVLERAGWITPVPGGVGPMTIAMLMKNVLKATKYNGK